MSAISVYDNLEWARWLDSMEGVPDGVGTAEAAAEREALAGWQRQGREVFQWLGTLMPGLTLALGLAFIGEQLAQWLGTSVLGFARSPVSAIPLAIILGLALRNILGLPAVYEQGLHICLRHVLRFGIVLLGLRLSLAAIGQIGLLALPIVVASIATALVVVTWITRALGLPRRLGSLIAVGTSICGVSAIVATAPVIEAEDDEVSYAVACVSLFGMLALFCYPLLAYFLFGGTPELAGIFLGTAIHDTAQVAGAGLMYQQQFQEPGALNTAAVTKLVRNLCMAGVIPLMAVLYLRSTRERHRSQNWRQLVPLFVVAFLIMAAIRTVGDLGEQPFLVLSRESWQRGLALADQLSAWCLAVAMASVGLGTGLAKLKNLGLKPFCVGLAAALLVGGVSGTLLLLLRPLM